MGTTRLASLIPLSRTLMKALKMIAWWLLIIGGLNWGLVGIGGFAGSNWNVVNIIFGSLPWLEWLIYVLVGLSALWLIFAKSMKAPMSAPMPMHQQM